ncbi:proton-conducting transporter membrane subunit [Mesorhizobium sp. YIM 152430]|uniref:hydrogen gas-evolving membrane-bound hydrogenase subunit E n=1 Tax=Mesorhizobium sp. YIM 152430 TaxID=3031761 RepID=UPI0023DA740D|nr:hydrogen gas-evolving membrane-bound hydrogenase subunit E [Mesorhizobium sp. YIM 152430]MDF1601880.1 proton-conducting transporter membrane subunit [Mesorhizobium sp. YIM 152430]
MSFEWSILVALAGAAIAPPAASLLGRGTGWVMSLVPLVIFASIFAHIGPVAGGEVMIAQLAWVPSLGVDLAFRLDGFSLLFALLISGIGTLVTIYAGAYFAEKPSAEIGRFLSLIMLFMAAMLGTVLSDNLIVMFVFWELTSLTSFLLIGFDGHKEAARKSALQSLIVTGGGGLVLFAGILVIGMTMDTFSFTEVVARSDELVASPWATAIAVLVMIGAFTKSAQFPFHFWLPNAMAAPTPASAYLHSATMVKLGVFLLARFDGVFADMPAFGQTLVIFGSLTMIVAALLALRAESFKAVLAQSTVASLGILVMLIGLTGEVAAVATVGFILAHALYKAALFFCAGTAIHATGEAGLRKLGGLARFLPATAVAAVLASLSMAGLPPFVGFISKEYLFEAQLANDWNILPVAAAVLVNAVMVGVAGVVSIRPFYFKPERVTEIHHGETPGLLLGPLLLAAGGILIGLVPAPAAQWLIGPAASALYGQPIDVSFQLWHGLTPMLVLSILVVSIGAVIVVQWTRIHNLLRRYDNLYAWLGDRFYHGALDGVLGAARLSTRTLQNGDQHRYTTLVILTIIAGLAFAFLSAPSSDFLASEGGIRLSVTLVLLLTVVGAAGTIFVRSLIAGLVSVGIVGFGSALIFMLNGAPDLALTQIAVETLIVILMTAVLLKLPSRRRHSRTGPERRRDGLIATGFAVMMFIAVASIGVTPIDLRLSDYFGETSYLEAYGRNVVNVILVDYRAIDTLGEIAVVALATIAAWGLLRGALKPARNKE